jgi:uncharacterized protein YdbL (DUF1318 family)
MDYKMRIKQISKRTLSALILSLLMALPAFALDLHDAKYQGLVGETISGYLAAVQPSSDVTALIDNINQQRKAYYQKIADNNNISLEAVEVRAGHKAIDKTPAGEFINTGAGWQKK